MQRCTKSEFNAQLIGWTSFEKLEIQFLMMVIIILEQLLIN